MVSAPPFSPHDRRLLNALFLLRGDLTLLAKQENTHILDLIAWSESPAIQTVIAKIKALREFSDGLHRSDTHRQAIDKLVHILKTSTNLVELRRTATTILRGPTTTPREPRTSKPAASAHAPPTGELSQSSATDEAPTSTSSLPTLREPAPRVARPGSGPEGPRVGRADLGTPTLRVGSFAAPSILHCAAGAPSPRAAPPIELLESLTSPHAQFAALPRAP